MNELQESLSKLTIDGMLVRLPKELLLNYSEVKKALTKAGGTYKNNTFIFKQDPTPLLERLISGNSINIKKEYQFFPTPKKVVELMLDNVMFNNKMNILEPSAGDGAILDVLVEQLKRKGLNYKITAIEIMPENAKVLRDKGYDVIEGDFLEYNTTEKFDLIIANPPFTKNQDIDHIMHMLKFKKWHGQVISLSSPHWRNASDNKSKTFRNFIEETSPLIRSLPAGMFKESGTNIETILLSF